MKEPKDMTREELSAYLMGVAVALRYEGKSAYVAEQIEEAAARLRNSIDRPKVEVVKTELEPFGRAYRPSINGYLLGTNTPHMQDAVREAQHFAAALRVHLDLRYGPLGMEGGA